MNDRFARETAQHAHRRIADLTRQLGQLERAITRRRGFVDRCYLCGDPIRKGSRYCRAHDWAEGR